MLRVSGGDRLETAQRELREVERRLASVRENRARLDEDLRALGEPETTRERFEAVLARASDSLSAADAKRDTRAAWSDAVAERKAAARELAELEAEERSASGRRDSIPRPLHEARARVAEAAGLSEDDLPFVGELVEVRAEFEPWREAFTLALGGFATTLMIDVEHLDRFRAAIDRVRLPVRLRYEGCRPALRRCAASTSARCPAGSTTAPLPSPAGSRTASSTGSGSSASTGPTSSGGTAWR